MSSCTIDKADLLASLRLESLPGLAPLGGFGAVSTGAGAPAILYGLEFEVGGASYEVRALRVSTTSAAPAAPYFGLYRCDPDCTEQSRLSGGIGTTGQEVLVSIPLSAVGTEEGATVAGIRAFTALGQAVTGNLVGIDEVGLPDAVIPAARVELGVAPAANPEQSATYTTTADLAEGRLTGALDVSQLGPGDYRAWARACLGEVCGVHSVAVSF